MKKMILLLMLPLTALMAIEFVMTRDGLVDAKNFETTTPTQPGDTSPSTPSSYLEPVNLPACDASNPEVQFINKNSDWDNINSGNKSIFCVSPGDYTALGDIELTRSGTAEKRRYIILNNGNDTHPGKLADSEKSFFPSIRIGGDYWILDRPTIVNNGDYVIRLENSASFNIINRYYTNDVGCSVTIGHLSHNNTIQNSRFENQRDPGYDGSVAIQIAAWGTDYFQVHNTKVINNEFYNQNDGFQIVRASASTGYTTPYQDGNAEGTIIDSNHFYKDIPYMENAIDLKCGSDNRDNPVIISNNHIWGYSRHPDYINGSYPPGKWAIVAHYSPKNIKIINNIIFDSDVGLAAGSNGPSSGFDKGLISSEVKNNLFYNCGSNERSEYVIRFSSARSTDMSGNTIVNSKYEYGTFSDNREESYFKNNDICNTSMKYSSYNNDSSFENLLSTNKKCTESYQRDYVFYTDIFTNNKKEIVLKNALKSNL